jgi:murein DD-endopeptidase MepM/ murein hydrolase activator NlpD
VNRGRWTIHFVRQDGLETRRVRAGGVASVVSGILMTLVLVGGGVWLGRAWGDRTEAETVATLRSQVQSLQTRERAVAELAGRLERVERDYRRLQAVVTEGAPSAAPSVALPARPESPVMGADGGTSAPAWPIAQRGFVTRVFGSLGEPASTQGHTGVDIAVPTGSYVRAMWEGVVEEAGEDVVYGRYVRIAHRDAISSLYGHNSWLFVAKGDSVERLQVVALSGSTGRSTAPHLHFEISRDGELVDPLAFVNEGAVVTVCGESRPGGDQR